MFKNSSVRAAVVMLFVAVFFSSVAYADPLSVRLRIEATNATGGSPQLFVIDDNGLLDEDGGILGTIAFTQDIGDFFFQLTVGLTQVDPTLSYLTLISHVSTTDIENPGGTIKISLEASNYVAPAPVVVLTGQLGGFINDGEFFPLMPSGTFDATEGSTAEFHTWINTENGTGPGIEVPLGNPFSPGSLSASGQTPVLPVSLLPEGNSYSLGSEAEINFTGSGSADFSLVAAVSSDPGLLTGDPVPNVPEPTSLLLLGTGLVALGLFGKKKGRSE